MGLRNIDHTAVIALALLGDAEGSYTDVGSGSCTGLLWDGSESGSQADPSLSPFTLYANGDANPWLVSREACEYACTDAGPTCTGYAYDDTGSRRCLIFVPRLQPDAPVGWTRWQADLISNPLGLRGTTLTGSTGVGPFTCHIRDPGFMKVGDGFCTGRAQATDGRPDFCADEGWCGNRISSLVTVSSAIAGSRQDCEDTCTALEFQGCEGYTWRNDGASVECNIHGAGMSELEMLGWEANAANATAIGSTTLSITGQYECYSRFQFVGFGGCTDSSPPHVNMVEYRRHNGLGDRQGCARECAALGLRCEGYSWGLQNGACELYGPLADSCISQWEVSGGVIGTAESDCDVDGLCSSSGEDNCVQLGSDCLFIDGTPSSQWSCTNRVATAIGGSNGNSAYVCYAHLPWIENPNQDCKGFWTRCTATCERGPARQWVQYSARAGLGAACPSTAPHCVSGQDDCITFQYIGRGKCAGP
eukprot:COSAG02_NODE_9261_length_2275_cov_3.133272_1_plen_475_part_10